jgi:hypothetical protein
LLATLLIATTIGCVNLPKGKITLPAKPERQEIEAPDTLKDYAEIINYYEHLVQEWELWGETATTLIESE